MKYIKDNIQEIKQSPTVKINELSNELIKQGRHVYKLGLGQSPFPVPEFLQAELAKHVDKRSYLPTQGLPELRNAISDWYGSMGVESSDDNILVGSGTKGLMYVAQVVFSGCVLVPQASWVSYAPQSIISNTRFAWVPTHESDDFKLSPHELDKICKEISGPKLLILNSPSNPTGAVYEEGEIKALAEVAKKWDIIVLSDDIYGRLSHSSKHVSFAAHYPQKTIISDGLSKWAGAGGWRVGHFHIPSELDGFKKKMISVISEVFSSTTAPIQHAAIAAYTEQDKIEKYIQGCNKILVGLSGELSKILAQSNIKAPAMLGGFYCFPGFENYRDSLTKRNIHTSEQLSLALLNETGVAGLSGDHFGCDPLDLRMRLSYVNFSGKAALDALKKEADATEALIKNNCNETLLAFSNIVSWLNSL